MNKKGFTLMELLIVTIIIATFAAMTYPSFRSAVERARASEAVHMIAAIQAAQQKHLVNYEVYGNDFRDINDFRPSIPDENFDPSSDHFSTEYYLYEMDRVLNRVIATRIDGQGNEVDKGYTLIGLYTDNFVMCQVSNDEGEKVCSALTDRNKVANYYPVL